MEAVAIIPTPKPLEMPSLRHAVSARLTSWSRVV